MSAGDSFGRSIDSVTLLILPVNANGGLVVRVVHPRQGLRADVQALVELQGERDRPLRLVVSDFLARQLAATGQATQHGAESSSEEERDDRVL